MTLCPTERGMVCKGLRLPLVRREGLERCRRRFEKVPLAEPVTAHTASWTSDTSPTHLIALQVPLTARSAVQGGLDRLETTESSRPGVPLRNE